ncbi:MAG TPA: methylthioribulose 1-phosphate dehydratase [Actinomycetota bacterium]
MSDRATKDLLCELLRLFYDRGWVSGTGGGICGPTDDGTMFLAPTGVHKERVTPEDFFVVDPADCSVVVPAADATLRPSECNAIFSACWRARGARSVMHSHALSSVLAADLAGDGDNISIAGLEMLKGIRGVANRDTHLVPVIRNTPREGELVDQVDKALADDRFAAAFCILVADHGAYIWGDDMWEAKRHTEVYHFLFEAAVARRR